MCTVTFLPTATGFVLTHNRDEAPARSPQRILREKMASDTLVFPRDTKAGGAWITAARSGKAACLLNGAFVKHRHEPPYRRSRGLMLLDFFEEKTPDHFFKSYELADIEPFTFLFFAPGQAVEWRWDGQQRHLKHLPTDQQHFWCSATLYPPDMQAQREAVFRAWWSGVGQHLDLRQLPTAIRNLHLRGSVGDPANDFVMNRDNRVRTVSVTQVVFDGAAFRMRYLDLLEGNRDVKALRL